MNDREFREDSESSYLEEILEENILVNSEEIEEVITDWESYFKSLHLQFEEESRSIAKENVNRQLIEIRNHKHQNYAKEKNPDVTIESQDNNNNKKSRILIASDSMMNQIRNFR